MLPRENVMHSFVIEDAKKKDVTDFFSFYYLPSTVLAKTGGHSKINVLITTKSIYVGSVLVLQCDDSQFAGRGDEAGLAESEVAEHRRL